MNKTLSVFPHFEFLAQYCVIRAETFSNTLINSRMKNTIFLALAALLFTASVQAQSTVDSIAAKYKLVPMPEPLTIEKTFPVLGTYQLTTGADASVTTATTANTTTPSGTETPTMTTTNNVVVTLDQENKGAIWVEGLPQGKFKAYLKKSPSTYRILAQKTETGNSVPEGTLIFDPETKVLNIALGKDFDDADPAAIFALNPALMGAATTDATAATDNTVKVKVKTATSKSKAKVTYFTANKLEQTTTATDAPAAAATQEPQQPAQQ